MTRSILNVIRKGLWNRTAALVVAGAASTMGFARPAVAGGYDRGRDCDRGHVQVNILPEARRVWVEPIYEERQTRVWVPAAYRTVVERVWVEPVYRDVVERVWVPAVVKTHTERVWVEPLYRILEKRDHTGRIYYRERVLSRPGRWEEQVVEHKIAPGRWEERVRRDCVTPGHFEDRTRQECVAPAHWEVRRERVCMRPGHWVEQPTHRSIFDIRVDGFAARFRIGSY